MKLALRMPEPRVLIALFMATGALWTFEEIQDKFVSGRGRAVDTAILLAFRTPSDLTDPVGPGWVEGLARDITALGGVGVLALVIAASVLFLFIARERSGAWMLLAAWIGGTTGTFVLKSLFARPRPDLLFHDVAVYSSSFPSGHAVMAAVTYLTLGALIARKLQSLLLKAYVMFVAVAVTILVGVSRVYLGVHWPSDVLGGWSLGAGWALICWAVAEWFEKREVANEGTSIQPKA